MPIKKSAFKSLRQAKKREIKNEKIKANLKYLERKFKKFLAEKNNEKAKEFFLKLQKALDKASQKRVINKNKAARKKSRLAKKLSR